MCVPNQASGYLGQPGHISCALGPVHVTGVWFGFTHAAEMPRCSTNMEITDDCIVRKILPSRVIKITINAKRKYQKRAIKM